MSRTIRIGSRRSRLSLWQADDAARLIRACYADVRVEVKTFHTRGDKNLTKPLAEIGGKGVFTQELEAALRQGEIDCAVHSLKDLPTEDAAGLCVAAVPKRGLPCDALVSRAGQKLDELPKAACIGTGSLRRRAQLLYQRRDLRILDIRGNVPTRLEKLMAEGSPYDAIVLAAAGLARLGLADVISERFAMSRLVNAAGQGALAIQCRAEAGEMDFFGRLNDERSQVAVTAERAFLAALDAGCSLPVGAYAFVKNQRLHLHGRVTATNGSRQVDVKGAAALAVGSETVSAARRLGVDLAEHALKQGAADILQNVES